MLCGQFYCLQCIKMCSFIFCYFCFFWVFFWHDQLLVQNLMATVDSTILNRTLTNNVILKLHSKGLQTVPVILFIFTKFIALLSLLPTWSSWEQHFVKQFLLAGRVTNFQASTTEHTADSTSDCMHEASWSSPPSIISNSLFKITAFCICIWMYWWLPILKAVAGWYS